MVNLELKRFFSKAQDLYIKKKIKSDNLIFTGQVWDK